MSALARQWLAAVFLVGGAALFDVAMRLHPDFRRELARRIIGREVASIPPMLRGIACELTIDRSPLSDAEIRAYSLALGLCAGTLARAIGEPHDPLSAPIASPPAAEEIVH